MTVEELKAKKAELASKLEAAKLEKEVKAAELELNEIEKPSDVEVKSDAVRTSIDMAKTAKEGDFEKFSKQHADFIAANVEQKLESWEQKNAKRDVYFADSVKKAFGKNPSALNIAKEVAPVLPRLAQVADMLGVHVTELKSFKDLFGQVAKGDLDTAFKALEMQNEVLMRTKTLTVAGSGTGTEYVPTLFADRVAERLMDSNAVFSNLPVFDMPSNPWRNPIYTGVPTAYYVTEGATVGASDAATGGKDFDARKIAAKEIYSGEMGEDSIIAAMPFAEKVLMETLANAMERVAMMGDIDATASTNINLIDGTPTTTAGSASVYLTRDGFVRETFRTSGKTKDINSDIVAGIASLFSAMGVGALDPRQLIGFVNVNAAFSYMGSSSFQTWDKLGPSATLLNGMLGSIFGMPLVPTSGLPATTTAGKISANSLLNIYGSICIVKKNGVAIGFRRRPSLKELGGQEDKDVRAFVASVRLDPKVLQPNAADRAAVAYGYKIALL
jgi:HK97 family phage major capsid protein